MPRAELLALVLSATACDEPNDLSPPTDPEEIGSWLAERGYEEWEGESIVRARDGVGGAQVFMSPRLTESMELGRAEHPEGAGAVRVLYRDDLRTVFGFAMAVKVDSESTGPENWLWYEVLDPDPTAAPSVAQRGATGCVGCHGEGSDFVQSSYPLR